MKPGDLGPLSGLRVLQCSGGIAASVAGMLLADLGADVVKLESSPWQLPAAHRGRAVWDRNKRVFSGESPIAGRATAQRLATDADLVLTDSADPDDPGLPLLDAAGRNLPGLVALDLPEDHHSATGADANARLAAACGGAMKQGSLDGGPIAAAIPDLKYLQGGWAAACGLAALLERDRSGLGQQVLVRGIHAAMVTSMLGFTFDPSSPPSSDGLGGARGRSPYYRLYRCADRRWIVVAALTKKFQLRFLEAIGLGELLDDPRVAGDPMQVFSSAEHRTWMMDTCEQRMATRSSESWISQFHSAQVPSVVAERREHWLEHPVLETTGHHLRVEDPERGQVSMPGQFLNLRRAPAGVRHAGTLRPDQGTPAWRDRAARQAVGLPRGRGPARGPLDGLNVLDLGTMLAGPMTGCLLAELGAQVVKLEGPGGDPFRQTGWMYNRGMRSLALDLRAPAGAALLRDLLARQDVVISSFRPQVAAQIGLDAEALERSLPSLVSLRITGFGLDNSFSDDPAFDPVLQALSGLMYGQGGDDPVFLTYALNDVGSATLGVLGILAALWRRSTTGDGEEVAVSLAVTSTFLQSAELTSFSGAPGNREGADTRRGDDHFDRYYRTADGWVHLYWPQAEPLTPADTPPAGHPPSTEPASPAADPLEQLIALMNTDQLRRAVGSSGGVVTPVTTMADPSFQNELLDGGVLAAVTRASDGAQLLVPGPLVSFSRTPRQGGPLLPPGTGEHSRSILAASGLSHPEIDRLVSSGVVTLGSAFDYQPTVQYR